MCLDPSDGIGTKVLGGLGSKLDLAVFMQWKCETEHPQELNITDGISHPGKGHTDGLACTHFDNPCDFLWWWADELRADFKMYI